MAVLYPSLPPSIPVTGLQRELDVLRVLEQSLSEGYEIFHSVPWHTVHDGRDRHGEIDLVLPDFRVEGQQVVGIPPVPCCNAKIRKAKPQAIPN